MWFIHSEVRDLEDKSFSKVVSIAHVQSTIKKESDAWDQVMIALSMVTLSS